VQSLYDVHRHEIVRQRLAHAHEDHVRHRRGAAARAAEHHLFQDFGRAEVSG